MNKFIKTSQKITATGLIALSALFVTIQSFPSTYTTPHAQAASVDYFLEIDGIEGESADPIHTGSLDIESFSWGQSNPGIERSTSIGGGGAGKANFNDISFAKTIDKATPKLMLAAATGQHIKEAKLFVRKSGETRQDYYIIKLKDVIVSSYQTGGHSGTEPTDSFSLNFSKIEFEYFPIGADGQTSASVKAGYDLKLNKKI